MQVGDLVGYVNSEFVSTRVHEKFLGLVVKIDQSRFISGRPICVKWNSKETRFQIMWHRPEDLRIVVNAPK